MSNEKTASKQPQGHVPEVETIEILEIIDIEEHSKKHGD